MVQERITRVRNKTIKTILEEIANTANIPYQHALNELLEYLGEGYVIGTDTKEKVVYRYFKKVNGNRGGLKSQTPLRCKDNDIHNILQYVSNQTKTTYQHTWEVFCDYIEEGNRVTIRTSQELIKRIVES